MPRDDAFISLCAEEADTLNKLSAEVFRRLYEGSGVRDVSLSSVVSVLVMLAPDEKPPRMGGCQSGRVKLHVTLPRRLYARLRLLRERYHRTYREIVMYSLQRLLERSGSMEDAAARIAEILYSTPELAGGRRHGSPDRPIGGRQGVQEAWWG